MTKPTAVAVEAGTKKTFAWALDWPGWCRSGRSEEAALEALAAYAARYAPVAEEAGVRFPVGVADAFTIVTRVPGDAGTEFGVPSAVTPADREPVTAAQAKRLVSLVDAAWAHFDRVAAHAPAELRKGPRGGGRDRDKMIDHVLSAEAAYARKVGLKIRPPAVGDTAAADAMRAQIRDVLHAASDGSPIGGNGWPPRYAVRRIAWHALDHAWEMQDRTDAG